MRQRSVAWPLVLGLVAVIAFLAVLTTAHAPRDSVSSSTAHRGGVAGAGSGSRHAVPEDVVPRASANAGADVGGGRLGGSTMNLGGSRSNSEHEVEAEGEGMPGGLSHERPVDDTVVQIVRSLAPAILASAGLTSTPEAAAALTPLTYKSQVVAGINYFVKCSTGAGPSATYLVVRIYRPLPGQGEPQVAATRRLPKRTSPITYFA